jgi:hypothetical protein
MRLHRLHSQYGLQSKPRRVHRAFRTGDGTLKCGTEDGYSERVRRTSFDVSLLQRLAVWMQHADSRSFSAYLTVLT